MKARTILTVLTLTVAATLCTAETAPETAPGLTFRDVVDVEASAPFLQPVERGQSVRVRFPVGSLRIEARDVFAVETTLDITCRKLSERLCERYRSRLRLEGEVRDGVVEVRLVGLPKWKLRKLQLEGEVIVPRWAPLEARIGIGDVDIVAPDRDLAVAMGIGDLTVHAPYELFGAVAAKTGIGDATVSGRARAHTRRKRLIGARVRWEEGVGESSIRVGLRIGDARVVLE